MWEGTELQREQEEQNQQDAKLQKTFQQHLIKTVHICNRQKIKTFTRKQKKRGEEKPTKRSDLVNHRRFWKKQQAFEQRPVAERAVHLELGVLSHCLPAEVTPAGIVRDVQSTAPAHSTSSLWGAATAAFPLVSRQGFE